MPGMQCNQLLKLHLSGSLYKAPNKTNLDLGKNISKRTRFVSDWVFKTLQNILDGAILQK